MGDRSLFNRSYRPGRVRIGSNSNTVRTLGLLRRLVQFETLPPAQVLLTIRNADFGFNEIVNSSASKEDMTLIIGVIASACKPTIHRRDMLAFITELLHSKLISEHLPNYLNKVPHMLNSGKLEFLGKMVVPLKYFLKTALSCVYTLAIEKLDLCINSFHIALGAVLQQLPSSETAKGEYKEILAELGEMLKTIQKVYVEAEKKASDRRDAGIGKPPGNFRHIPIAPTAAELKEDVQPFLRENKISGKYMDGEHYLDVQFRLLREDLVGPLREGIAKYRQLVGAASTGKGASKALAAMKDLSIYRRVKVQQTEFTESGKIHVLQLDVACLQNVDWKNSKKFLPGSLLCISPDDFVNVALAIVLRREVEDLMKGLLGVQIIEGRAVLDSPKSWHLGFIMTESPSYFEAVSPILRGLQALEGDQLPFSKYIIELNTNMDPPKYATPEMKYDFTPLLRKPRKDKNPLSGLKLLCLQGDDDKPSHRDEDDDLSSDDDEEWLFQKDDDSSSEEAVRWVPILHADQWPDKHEFGFDESQLHAFKAALTKQVAIIQGPPGTGKTFLGLKIVKTLIHNCDAWITRVAPILILCYTNHALDQFLVGILRQVGTKGIVRVGGRSRDKRLDPYNLKELRKNETLKIIPRTVRQRSQEIRDQMHSVGNEITRKKNLLIASRQTAISEFILHQFMSNAHRHYMSEIVMRKGATFGMLVWLCGAITRHDCAMMGRNCVKSLNLEAEKAPTNKFTAANRNQNGDFHAYERLLDENRFRVIWDKNNDEDADRETREKQNIFDGILSRKMMIEDVMTEQEVDRVHYLSHMSPYARWRLYRYWVSELRADHENRIEHLQQEYESLHTKLKEAETEEDILILRNATIVGMTTTGAAKCQAVLQEIRPQIVIVEEAAEVFEAHIVTALTQDCDHLILIGDHQQLRPNPNVYKLAKSYNLDVSLFERLLRNGIPYESLKLQHRMRPEIARLLVPNIYKELYNDPSVQLRPSIKGVGHNVYFVSHSIHEENASDSTSKENLFEAEYAAALCRHLILQDYETHQITVLTTYVGQMVQLQNKMNTPEFEGVTISVVDNYQGEENDIVILSFVRSNNECKIGFLSVENRVCVALSRARNGLFAIGNFDFLVENCGRVWNPIVSHVARAGLIGPTLRLVCQKHSDFTIEAKSAADFKLSPEGGCCRPCDFRLPCGHQCYLLCHSYDPEHRTEKTRCPKPCVKTCERGHGCDKICYKKCRCLVEVENTFEKCGHTVKLSCYQLHKDTVCPEMCNKILNCGHKCGNKCIDECEGMCQTEVDGQCEHIKVKCWKKSLLHSDRHCSIACSQTLSCGHACTGTCDDCHQGRFHKQCKEMCSRVLVCGHPCKVPCAVVCPPCTRRCEITCIHAKCYNRCGVPCNPCLEKCPWQCAHHKCTQPCFELCDRPPCEKPCKRRLKCGHQCIGMCGEPCPWMCRICNRRMVCEIIFGNEYKRNARFVLLEDCGHIIEVKAMDKWMKEEGEETQHQEVNIKGCPKCKTVIRRSLRYGNQLKKMQMNVNEIRKRITDQMQRKELWKTEIKARFQTSCIKFSSIKTKIEQSLERHLIPGFEYTLLDNLAIFCNLMETVHSNIVQLEAVSAVYSFKTHLKAIKDCVKPIEHWILQMVPLQEITLEEMQYGSEQRVNDVARELYRVKYHIKLLAIFYDKPRCQTIKELYNDALSLVNSTKPFTEDLENAVVNIITEMYKIQGDSGTRNVKEIQFVKAIGMKSGMWFKCLNGHIYMYTHSNKETLIEDRCTECQTAINTDTGASQETSNIPARNDSSIELGHK